MSVGRKYYPPRVSVPVFNPDNFIDLGQITASSTSQTTIDLLKAETDIVTADADAQNLKFKQITEIPIESSPPYYNESLAISGFFNGTQTLIIPYVFSIEYYYFVSINFNYVQVGSAPIDRILVNDTNWTITQQFWDNTNLSNAQGVNPSFQMTFAGVGTGVQPSFTITYPGSVTSNSFTLTGKYTIIGIQTIK
jgi:hypothetical protein